jgi:protein involved in polysaccharide export with SLBB domain
MSGGHRMLVLAAAFALSGCGLFGGGDAPQTSAVQPGALKPGDMLRITVVGEEELSGVFPVAEDRMVHLELVGAVPAGGLTLPAFEDILRSKLAAGYLKDPQILVARVTAPPAGVTQPTAPSLPAPVLRSSQ